MYSVRIREHIMIAHSLAGEVFGPAQKLHGATYVVDAEFETENVDENNIVLDMGLATKILKDSLAPLAYQNLDDLPQFKGKVTTTEFLAKHTHDSIREALNGALKGNLKVIYGESHVAWASYSGAL